MLVFIILFRIFKHTKALFFWYFWLLAASSLLWFGIMSAVAINLKQETFIINHLLFKCLHMQFNQITRNGIHKHIITLQEVVKINRSHKYNSWRVKIEFYRSIRIIIPSQQEFQINTHSRSSMRLKIHLLPVKIHFLENYDRNSRINRKILKFRNLI